ncbi:Putative O-antigen transporter [Aeromonas rivipollensis]|uniref:oligosaccharide flippase family protein n=1 Tax=Aeromonas rivipollensis TaxID=948519 RepID=UPI00399D095C
MKFLKKNEISTNIIALFFVQFANYISPLLVLPYLSRVLGLDGFGIVAIAMSLCGIVLIITDYGFGLSAPYWLAKNKAHKNQVAEYLGAIFIIKFILFSICTAVVTYYFFFLQAVMPHTLLFFGALVSSILFQTFQPNWFFLGIEKMKNVTFFMVVAKLSYLMLVFTIVKKQTQIDLVIVCFAVSNLLATAIGIWFIYKEGYRVSKPRVMLSLTVFKDGGFFFLSRLAVGVYTSASTFFVGSFSGASAAALYNSAEKIYQAGQSATSPVSQALFPYLARTGRKDVLYKAVGGLFIPMVIGSSFCIYYSDYIVVLFFGEEFHAASNLLNIFMVTLLVNFIGVNFGYPAFSSINRVDVANKSVLFSSILQLVFLIIMYLTDSISPINICYSVLTIEVVVMLIRVSFFVYLSRNSISREKFS